MYKHLLLPIDGSDLSALAIEQCMQFAKCLGAKVTGLYVCPEFNVITLQTEMVENTREQFRKDAELHAERYLSAVKNAADAAEVACDTLHVVGNQPHESIIGVARQHGCDAIVMASHGRSGLKGLLLGSVTQKVLAHSLIPVLVLR